MSDTIKKLVAKEFVMESEMTITYPAGYRYVYWVDPETDTCYEPNPESVIEGENLESFRVFDQMQNYKKGQ